MALPELYQEKEYQRKTFDRNSEFMKHNPNLTARGTRKFNRYWNSDQRLADEKAFNEKEDAAEAAFVQGEIDKRAASWDARIAALREQNKARGEEALKNINASLAAKPDPTPVTKTLTPRSEAEWNRIASEATNGQLKTMADVEAWQRANGFSEDQIDGKFGNNSSAYFKTNGLGKYQRTPVEETSPDFIGPVRPPKPSSDAPVQPGTSPQSTKFSFDNFIRNNNSTIHWIGGKQYARYDPKGRGDFYVDESGNTYKANWGGDLGNALDANKSAFHNDLNVEAGYKWKDLLNNIQASYQKQGGTMNRINYFQQGGAAPQQDIKAQITALIQAAMQGDQKATQQVNQIMEAAKAGDQQAMQIAQIMEQVIKELQGQAVAAKYGAKLSYLQSLKCGGKTKKKEKGGKVCPECEKTNNKQVISKHQSGGAVGFYRNWSKDEVRKLQNRLAAYGYYDGELDGIVGSQTIAAVKKFQTEHGVKADGMWGHNTNTQKQFVDASTADKGSYKKNWKTEQGSLRTYDVAGKKMKENDYYRAVNNLKEQFYADPEAFWNAGGDTAKWREHLYTTPEGTAIMEEFYSATPDDVKKRLGSRVTNRRMQQDQMDSGIREANGRAARVAVTKVLPVMGGIAAAPAMLLNPVTAGLGIGGGLAGRGIAGNVAENLTAGDTSTWTATDGMGNVASVATPTSDLAVPVAEAVGGAAGAAAGVWGSQYVGAPSTQGLAGYQRTNNSAPARTYRSQRRIGVGRFGKQGHLGDGKALDRQVRLNDGTFGFRYQPATPRYQAYLEGAGGNPSYTVVPIGMKNGGNFPKKKYFSLI